MKRLSTTATSAWTLLAVAGLALAAPPLAAQSTTEIDIPFEKHVLDNGLTLIIHEDHKAPIVAVNVWYHVGSKNEKVGRTGFAHLFEHLMFNGSEHYNDDYFRVLEPLGATDLNGTTNEWTSSAAWCRTRSARVKTSPTARPGSPWPRTPTPRAIPTRGA
jgi:zinc protease